MQDKAGLAHWNNVRTCEPRMRLPRAYTTSIRDTMSLLRSETKQGMKFLEIGCAPGKVLSWVAGKLGASVSGLDYSGPGVQVTKKLFRELDLQADIRCEDVFASTFAEGSFDVVYSAGVIEHFEDPTELVRIHTKLTKPGGIALITIPNLRGIYGRMTSQRNLDIHNLNIMTRDALRQLAPSDLAESVTTYHYGRFTSSMTPLETRSAVLATSVRVIGDTIGLLQPFSIRALCPRLVLRIQRKQ